MPTPENGAAAQRNPLPEALVTLTCKDCLTCIGTWNLRTHLIITEITKARREHAIAAHEWKRSLARSTTR